MIPDGESLAFSRPAAAADSLGDKAPDRHRFTEKRGSPYVRRARSWI